MPNDNGQDREPLNSSSPFIRQRLGSSSSADGDTQDSPLTISVSDPTQKGESSFWSGTKLVWYYIFAEVKRQPLSFVLAVFTVFITVLVISLLASAVSTSNLIFFRMAEINAGEQDLILNPGMGLVEERSSFQQGNPFLNQTVSDIALFGGGTPYDTYSSNTPQSTETAGLSSRFLMFSQIDSPLRISPDGSEHHISSGLPASGITVGIDSVRERIMGVGRNWNLSKSPIPHQGLYISRTLVRQTGVQDDLIQLIQQQATDRFNRYKKAKYDPTVANTYYKRRNPTTGEWEGPASSVLPLLTILLRIDATQLVAQLVGDTIPMSRGDGTDRAPYIIELFKQPTALSLVEMSGITPPEECSSWSVCWNREVRHSQLAQQIDYAQVFPIQQILDRFVEEAMKLDPLHPLRVFVMAMNDVTLDIPITRVATIWDAMFNDNLPLSFRLGSNYYRYYEKTTSFIPNARDLHPDVVVPTFQLRIIRDQPNPDPHFTFDADLFNTSFRQAIRFDAKPPPPAPNDAFYPKGGTFGDYYTSLISVSLGLIKSNKEHVVADVIGSPQGKLAETLGAVIMSELEPLVSSLKDPVLEAIGSEVTMVIPPFEIDIGTMIDESNIIIDGVPIVVGPYIITFDGAEYKISYRDYLINVEQLTEEEADKRISETKQLIQQSAGRDIAPMIIIQMGPGGSEDIKEAYRQRDEEKQTSLLRFFNPSRLVSSVKSYLGLATTDMPLSSALAHLYNNINYQHHPDAMLNIDEWIENPNYSTEEGEDAHLVDNELVDEDHIGNLSSNHSNMSISSSPRSPQQTPPPPPAPQQETEYNLAPSPDLPDDVIRKRQAHRRKQYLCNENCMVENIANFANDAFLALGNSYPASVTPPLFEALKTSSFMVAFLDSLFGAIIGLICALSAILIYSLFLLDVEQKNYEYGILRALGMKQSQLVQLLIIKSFLVGIIGIALGLFASYLLYFPIANVIAREASVDSVGSLTTPAIIIAVCVGILVPLVSNTVPISRALSQVLRNALQLYHSSLSDITVTIKRLEEVGLDMWQTSIALMLICFGFMTFYLIPMSFLNQNIPMFLALLMIILSCMILGLSILAQIFQPYLELVFLWVISIRSPALHGIVKKALGAHRPNNTKVALMLTITVAFVVFAGVVFALQSSSLAASVRLLLGSPIIVTSPSIRMPLPEAELNGYLKQIKDITDPSHPMRGVVQDYSFITYTLFQATDYRRIRISPLSLQPEQYQQMYGIQSSFRYSSYISLYGETEGSITGPGIDAIFTSAGQAKLPYEPQTALEYEEFLNNMPDLSSGGLPLSGAMYTKHTQEAYNEIRKDIIKGLYTGYTDVLLNEAIRTPLALDTKVPVGMSFQATNRAHVKTVESPEDYKTIEPDQSFFNPGNAFVYMAKARAMVNSIPGFFFSKYSSLARAGATILPELQMWELIKRNAIERGLKTPPPIPKQRLMVYVPSHVHPSLREDVVAGIRSLLTSDQIIVTDTEKVIDAMQGSINLLNLLFIIVSVIAMVLCFIMMSIAVTANVHHNAWENGVLRSIGLTSVQVMLVYIFESLCIALSCLFTGTIIGILIAISLTLLFSLFTGLAFSMEFPYALYFSLIAMIIIVAIFSAFIPAYRFSRQKISSILRRT